MRAKLRYLLQYTSNCGNFGLQSMLGWGGWVARKACWECVALLWRQLAVVTYWRMPEAWVMLRRRNRRYEQDYISITNLISGHESLQQKTVLKQSLEAVPGVPNAWYALWSQGAPGCSCLVVLVGQAASVSGTWLGWHSTPDPKQDTHLGPSVPSCHSGLGVVAPTA